MERLGLGPNVLLKDNPQLIYARLSGFGQSGPIVNYAGHDINYLALSGVLSMLGRKGERPYPPINLLADFAGGGLTCALGIVMSLFERQTSGRGQVVDTNMVHGSAYVATFLWKSQGLPIWGGQRGENILDGGAPYYDIYETKDGKFMSVGALEPKFFQDLLKGLNISPSEAKQMEEPEKLRQKIQIVFKTKTRDEWSTVFRDYDACVQPVLDRDEAPLHPHNKATDVFLHNPVTNQKEPAPAPKLSRTPGISVVPPSPKIGMHTVEVLSEAGFDAQEISKLLQDGVIDTYRKAKL